MGSSGDKKHRLLAQSLKFLNAHCVLASALSGITPLLAFSLSGDDIGFENHCCGLLPLGSAKESTDDEFPTAVQLLTSFKMLGGFLSDKESLLLFGSGIAGRCSVASYGAVYSGC